MKVIFLIMIGLSLLRAEYIRDDVKEVVLDTATSLIWQDDVTPAIMTWTDAIIYCESSTLGSFNDWRLPNYNELYNLADRSIYSPALSPVFQNVFNSIYFSSTTMAHGITAAWYTEFSYGFDGGVGKTPGSYVRCVR